VHPSRKVGRIVFRQGSAPGGRLLQAVAKRLRHLSQGSDGAGALFDLDPFKPLGGDLLVGLEHAARRAEGLAGDL
jgi:hypothetical protein